MYNYLLIRAKSLTIRHVNYHYTQFGEIAGYLDNVFNNQLLVIDLDVLNIDLLQLYKKIIFYNIKYIAMWTTAENAQGTISLAKYLKQFLPNVSIMVYGQITVLNPRVFITPEINAIFRNGDPEIAIQSFFENYKTAPSKLKGLYTVKNYCLQETAPGEFISPDEWGKINFLKVPVDSYCKVKGKERFVINISRGCPFNCKHCLIPMCESTTERRRSLSNLTDYISIVYSRYSHIKLWAANFTLNKQYVKNFCEIRMQLFPKLTFESATRVDLLKDFSTIELLAQSGCTQITIGVETINDEKWIRSTKSYENSLTDKVIRELLNNNIKVKCCIMLGIPGQTKSSIYNTIEHLLNLDVEIRPTLFTPYYSLPSNTDISTFEMYNRKTFPVSLDGLSYHQLISLILDVNSYKEIFEQPSNY